MSQKSPTGSSSRQPAAPSVVLFKDAPAKPGAQRSHTIPKEIFNTKFPELFEEIRRAQLPDGQLPFDPNNFLDNGQLLPSANADANGRAIAEFSQHIGSHVQVNAVMERRLRVISEDLTKAPRQASPPEAENIARMEANAKVCSVADAMAAISI